MLNNEKQPFDIMILLDDDYLYYSLPFLYSLSVNNNSWAKITLHVLTNRLSDLSRVYLLNFCTEINLNVVYYDVDTAKFDGLKMSARYPALLYYKLIPHEVLPENIHRVLYLDVDMINTASLKDLYNTDIGNNYLGACYDVISFNRYINNADVAPILLSYCNSGTVLYNLDLMRHDNINLKTYTKWLETNRQTLYEEQLLNYTLLGHIYHFMPYDYNYHIGSIKVYNEYCSKNDIKQKKAIIHFFGFKFNSPIIKPWDAYEYFMEGKVNNVFPLEVYALFKLWWDYAFKLRPDIILSIINRVKISNRIEELRKDRDKWHNYSDTFKLLITKRILAFDSDLNIQFRNMLFRSGYKHIAIYGDTEITKVFTCILENTDISIDYIVENATKPFSDIKIISRNSANYPDCDFMLVADIYNYQAIKTKLERLKVSFPFANATEYIKTLPVAEEYGINKVKEKIQLLEHQLSLATSKHTDANNQIGGLCGLELKSEMSTAENGEKQVGKVEDYVSPMSELHAAKTKLAILGSCISRDTVQVNINNYDVGYYVTFISPYTIQNGKPFNIPQSVFKDSGVSNFVLRCLTLDANKKALDYLRAAHCDWLILDLTTLQSPIFEWEEGWLMSRPHQGNKCMPIIKEYLNSQTKFYESWELPKDVLHSRVAALCKSLLNIYDPKKIVFIETYCTDEFISKDGKLVSFGNEVKNRYNKINEVYRECYQIVKKCLEGCHVIRPLNNNLSLEKHKWGLHPLHYCDEYYEYAEKSINIIIQNFDRSLEDERLENLCKLYSEKFMVIRGRAIRNTLRADRDKWQNYSYSFKALIQNKQLFFDDNFNLQLQDYFLSKGYKRIAIYGDTEIAKVLCAVLKGSGVSIDYIVENASNPVPGFKTINRNAAEYLDCDVMLVADIYNFKDIKAKLEKLKVPFPFYNAAEFIQSLPAADGDGIDKIKEKIRNLNDRIVFEREEKERLDIQLSASTKREAELVEKVGTLTKRDTVSQEKIKSLSGDIKQLTATNRRVAEERDGCMGELESVKNSLSFRLGRAITFIPRKIRDAFKKSKK